MAARQVARAEHEAKVQADRAAAAKVKTFRQCANSYIAKHGAKWTNPKHGRQWRATLETYAYPVIGDLDVAAIDEGHLVKILEPIWRTKAETAQRLRGRIESVLDYATVAKFRRDLNPARWKGHLEILLGGKNDDTSASPNASFRCSLHLILVLSSAGEDSKKNIAPYQSALRKKVDCRPLTLSSRDSLNLYKNDRQDGAEF